MSPVAEHPEPINAEQRQLIDNYFTEIRLVKTTATARRFAGYLLAEVDRLATLVDAYRELADAHERYNASARIGRMSGATIDRLTAAKSAVRVLETPDV